MQIKGSSLRQCCAPDISLVRRYLLKSKSDGFTGFKFDYCMSKEGAIDDIVEHHGAVLRDELKLNNLVCRSSALLANNFSDNVSIQGVQIKDLDQETLDLHTGITNLFKRRPVILRVLTELDRNPKYFKSINCSREEANDIADALTAFGEAFSIETDICLNYQNSDIVFIDDNTPKAISNLCKRLAYSFRELAERSSENNANKIRVTPEQRMNLAFKKIFERT